MDEGWVVGVSTQRPVDPLEWQPRADTETAVKPEIDTPTRGVNEAVTSAQLTVVSLSQEPQHRTCLSAVEVLALSPTRTDASDWRDRRE
jgi:hypothetical protein